MGILTREPRENGLCWSHFLNLAKINQGSQFRDLLYPFLTSCFPLPHLSRVLSPSPLVCCPHLRLFVSVFPRPVWPRSPLPSLKPFILTIQQTQTRGKRPGE